MTQISKEPPGPEGMLAAAGSAAALQAELGVEIGRPVRRKVVQAWSLWDFGSNAFNTVILTFVFSVYITSTVAESELRGTQVFSNAQAWAGLVIALLAPVVGSFADRVRNRRLLLSVSTIAVVICMGLLFLVKPEDSYLVLGAMLIAIASVFAEIATVFYNGMLLQISTPKTYGRISGTAWALGYLGGVIALVIALFGFILDGGLLGITTDDALNVRSVALLCALWFLAFAIPIMILAPKEEPSADVSAWNPVRAYREILARVVHMWRSERHLLHFFVASAVYRDGLGAVFTFAGVLAANAYGFPLEKVIYFGIAANVIAGLGVWLTGRIDDRLGARTVIVGSLLGIVALGSVIVASDAEIVFWVCGLGIATFVGPVQSSSRTMLARMTSHDTASENFGLYATAGRAVSFLAPAAFAFFVKVTGEPRMGIVGIMVVLILGLALFWPLKVPAQPTAAG
ncbi:MAG: MFS transporter [Actinomycetales bacterium]|nr:MFS transporter [Actinomycetales bacterium]